MSDLIAQGGANPLLLALTALVLGSLHGLEPGHSKTMMAAYIVAVRGSVKQAVLLGVSAAASHSIIVWVLGILGAVYGDALIGEQLEPWFAMASGFIILGIAAWMFTRARPASVPQGHGHHPHDHGHCHGHCHDHGHSHGHDHTHDHGHHHDPALPDAHTLAHARQIEAQVAAGRTGTGQTILMGLSGGLIPCPAAITVLLICIQLGQLWLGATLVAAFSVGLALTLVAVGVVAAVGLRYVTRRTARFDAAMAKAPYLSAILIGVVGVIMIAVGWSHAGP
ncbi:MAG: nickel/cobalt efflux transporter RcnA [Rhodospirillaceae bacterium]|nr:nickel/cobalt efflux transporter RcnA [Rhodospirillaceae bacterium]